MNNNYDISKPADPLYSLPNSIYLHYTIMIHTHCHVAFVNQSRNHMRIFKIIVVMGTIYISWNNTSKLTAMLFVIGSKDKYSNKDYEKISQGSHIIKMTMRRFDRVPI